MCLLEASTPEAYGNAYDSMSLYIKSFPNGKSLESWLNWWHLRRKNIFRAFTGYSCPRSNQAEVVHASWTNRNEIGLSLHEAAEFDTRDTILIEAELDKLDQLNRGKGCGPTLHQLKNRKRERIVEEASRKGKDLIDFGVSESSNSNNDPCIPKKKKTDGSKNMFDRRMKAAEACTAMRVRKSHIVNDFKRKYVISNSSKSRQAFDVEISSQQTCTCSDFAKNGRKVACKHIIFVIIFVLDGKDIQSSLERKFISNNDLSALFSAAGSEVKPQYRQEKVLRGKTNFKEILANHEQFSQKQVWLAHKKIKRSAKCSNPSCRKIITIGTECLVVDGALTVPYNQSKAVNQKFYFCLSRLCSGNRPPWINVRDITELTFDKDFNDSKKNEIVVLLNL